MRQGILTSPRPSHTVILTPHILTPGHLAGIAQNGGARPNISSAKKGLGRVVCDLGVGEIRVGQIHL